MQEKVRFHGNQIRAILLKADVIVMIAFTAQYANGTITLDNNEIVAADWSSPHEFPEIPPKVSIARRLIDWFVERYLP